MENKKDWSSLAIWKYEKLKFWKNKNNSPNRDRYWELTDGKIIKDKCQTFILVYANNYWQKNYLLL